MTPDYKTLIDCVQETGCDVEVRGFRTKEILTARVRFPAGQRIVRKGTNAALGYMELLQLLAGTFDAEALKRVAPKANHSLFTPQMAYGPRIAPQLPQVLLELQQDPETRQAVIYVGKPFEMPDARPCTETIQFLIRRGELLTVVNMRSWDLVKGLTYDMVMFGGLALAAGAIIGVPAGAVLVSAGSAHVYDYDELKFPKKPLPDAGFRFQSLDADWTGVRNLLMGGSMGWQCGRLREWARARVEDESWTAGPPLGIQEW